MAESSEMVTPDRRFTDCGLVRDYSWSTAKLTPPAATVLGRDIDLGDLALEAGAGVEEDDPAEADDRVDLVADDEDDVLAFEGAGHRRQMVFDVLATELRMVGVVDLLAHVKLDEQGLDEVVLAFRQLFHVECPHCLDGTLW